MGRSMPTLRQTHSSARDRIGYFDLLRALALLRVITYHTVGWPWLHVLIPAIGLMFGLGGSLMARSLDRRTPVRVIASRLRRLLPPVWTFGIVALGVGWLTLGPAGHEWFRLFFWLVPLRDPEFNSTEFGFVDVLWYVRSYIWFVLLSPVLLAAFHKAPKTTLAAPLALLPVAALAPHYQEGHGALLTLFGFGACWLLGFAEYDGYLVNMPLRACCVVALVLGLPGLGLAVLFRTGASSDTGPSFIGYTLWSSAFVLVLMRWHPDTSWLRRMRWLDRTVAIVNARAVTIYVWHDAAIVLTSMFIHITRRHVNHLVELPIVLVLTAIAMILFGWVEDLAARRRPTLLPAPP